MQAVASFHYTAIFKKAFSQPDAFTAFVNDILGIEIKIDKVEIRKSLYNPFGKINSRFDLFAEDKTNHIIVNLQHYPDENNVHFHLYLHYHSAIIAQDYCPTFAVYTIVVLTSGDKHERDMLMIDFDPKDRHGVGVGEVPHKIIYLCPKHLNDETPTAWREWMLAINDSLDEEVDESVYLNENVQKVLQTIRKDSLTPQDRAFMKDEYSEEALRKEERAEAFQKGIEIGKSEHQEVVDIAANLMDILDDHTIAQKTGLSLEQVAQLRLDELLEEVKRA